MPRQANSQMAASVLVRRVRDLCRRAPGWPGRGVAGTVEVLAADQHRGADRADEGERRGDVQQLVERGGEARPQGQGYGAAVGRRRPRDQLPDRALSMSSIARIGPPAAIRPTSGTWTASSPRSRANAADLPGW